jgi:hypothetical protein
LGKGVSGEKKVPELVPRRGMNLNFTNKILKGGENVNHNLKF